ncbi:glutaredoxin 3 [Maricurvus nonylphenolicus]|uniref:glutaredoxin 3 n=1 Tax=Maricurvus nonylphenolicus TaxID=1008307 RepID=UPI0036F249BD
MSQVVIYTTRICPYCIRAKQLLQSKGVEFNEISVDAQPELRLEMMQKSGRRTVPQIWVGETHVGGFDDLWAMDRAGKLEPLLNALETA